MTAIVVCMMHFFPFWCGSGTPRGGWDIGCHTFEKGRLLRLNPRCSKASLHAHMFRWKIWKLLWWRQVWKAALAPIFNIRFKHQPSAALRQLRHHRCHATKSEKRTVLSFQIYGTRLCGMLPAKWIIVKTFAQKPHPNKFGHVGGRTPPNSSWCPCKRTFQPTVFWKVGNVAC